MTAHTTTYNMEEVELNKLAAEEQVSDDFELFTDGELFYAIRTRLGENSTSFCLEAKNKDTVVAMAVDTIHKAIVLFNEPVRVPLDLGLFYIMPEGNS